MADGHWVTINGNHVFIEDSSSEKNSGGDSGKVLKGRVENTGSPQPKNGGSGNKTPKGKDYPGGESGSDYPYKKTSMWKSIGKALITVASAALEAMAAGSSQSSDGNSHTYSSPKIQQYKSSIDNLVNLSKINLSDENEKLQKMIKEVSAMPKGQERDSKWEEVLSRGAEYDKAKATIDRIDVYNKNGMYKELKDELDKNVLPEISQSSSSQGYIDKIQSSGESSNPQVSSSYKPVTQNNPVYKGNNYKSHLYNTYSQVYGTAKAAEIVDNIKLSPAEESLINCLNEVYSDPYIFLPEIPMGKYAGQLLGKQPFVKGILKKLPEKDILRYIDKICAENKFLDKDRFTNYYELLKRYGLSPTLHGIERIEERTRTIKNLSFEKIMDTIISGEKWIDPKGNLTMIKGRITVHFNKQGEIITVIYREKFNPIKKGFKKWLKIENIGEKNAN